jgi:MFS family permease
MAALPGLLLGVVAWLFIAEPPRGRHDAGAADEVPPMREVLRRLFVLPSARNLVIGSALAAMFGFGLNYFFTSLMIRKFEVGLAEAGLYSGVIASLPAAVSVVASGWLGDRFGAKTPAAYALVPAICLLIGGPLYVLAITRESLGPLLGLISIATFLNFGYLGITFAALQNLMHPRMRVSAFAVLNVVYGVASAVGPLLLGALSDRMALSQGPAQGLTTAMAITGALYVWAGLHYLLAARRLAADQAAVRVAPGEEQTAG